MKDANIIVLKLQLKYADTVRVITVPATMRLSWLADVIKDCMGFDDSHMCGFTGKQFPQPDRLVLICESDEERDRSKIQIFRTFVCDAFPDPGAKAVFEYDYGDGWKILITRMADRKNIAPYTCIKSEGMNAIEDCGGSWGLERARFLLERFLANSSLEMNEDDECYFNWLVGDLDEEEELRQRAEKILHTPTRDEINELLARYTGINVSEDCGGKFSPSIQKPIHNKNPKVGRNDPCPCGSGKKYKKCCGKA